MSRLQATLAILLAAIGLFLSLWPALRAPVVLTSDSRIDLEWAKQGSGILTPAFAPRHPAKPAYLLFLRAATAAGGVRGIVVIQSLILWISFGVTALQTAALRGPNRGLALYAVLVLFLRVRDLSSSVMSEALAAALFLPLAALFLDSSRGHRRAFLLGLSIVALFLVRPNVGAVALLLAIVSLGLRGRKPEAATVIGAFLLVAIPVGILTSPSEDPLRGSSDTFLVASADYEWYPSIRAADRGISEAPSRELQRAAANWRTTLAAHGVDARRARVWRMLHGMLGTEYYDASWSAFYRDLTTASRLLSPFAILVAVAVLLAALGRGPGRLAAALGTCLVAALILQGIVLGALPRYGVPLLPGLFLFAVVAAPTRRAGERAPGRSGRSPDSSRGLRGLAAAGDGLGMGRDRVRGCTDPPDPSSPRTPRRRSGDAAPADRAARAAIGGASGGPRSGGRAPLSLDRWGRARKPGRFVSADGRAPYGPTATRM